MRAKIVLFVEGDTEDVFFKVLLHYYQQRSRKKIAEYEVVNMKSVTRYTSKMVGKLENELIPKAMERGYEIRAICCDYDTDVSNMASISPWTGRGWEDPYSTTHSCIFRVAEEKLTPTRNTLRGSERKGKSYCLSLICRNASSAEPSNFSSMT